LKYFTILSFQQIFITLSTDKLTICFGSSELSSGLKQAGFRKQRPFLIGCYLRALLTSHIKHIHIKSVIILRLLLCVRNAPFCVITRVVVISYRRFGTTYRPHLEGLKIPKVLNLLPTFRDNLHPILKDKKIPKKGLNFLQTFWGQPIGPHIQGSRIQIGQTIVFWIFDR